MRLTRALGQLAVIAALTLTFSTLAGCGSSDPKSKADSTSGANTSSGSPTKSSDSKPLDVCKAVTAEEIGTIVGGTVTSEVVPGGGCRFPQSDLRAATVALNVLPATDESGGIEGALSGIKATMKGAEPEELAGVGDQAYLLIGKALGGSNQQGSGLMKLGDNLVQVTLTQGKNMSVDEVRSILIATMTLVVKNG